MMPQPPDVVADRRRPPFCYQTHNALDAIRARFTGPRRVSVIGVYAILTEMANRSGGAAARGGFVARREDIAEAAGISVDTLDRYVRDLEAAGVLHVEHRRNEEGSTLRNQWVLTEPEPADLPPGGRTDAAGGGRTDAAPSTKKRSTKKGDANASPLGAEIAAPITDDLPAVPATRRVDGQNLGWNALADACGIRRDDRNRAGEIAEALNGGKRVQVGIRALAWKEALEHGGEDVVEAAMGENPDRFETFVSGLIARRAAQYRAALNGAILTPTALAKWWLSLERMSDDQRGQSLTPSQIEALDRD